MPSVVSRRCRSSSIVGIATGKCSNRLPKRCQHRTMTGTRCSTRPRQRAVNCRAAVGFYKDIHIFLSVCKDGAVLSVLKIKDNCFEYLRFLAEMSHIEKPVIPLVFNVNFGRKVGLRTGTVGRGEPRVERHLCWWCCEVDSMVLRSRSLVLMTVLLAVLSGSSKSGVGMDLGPRKWLRELIGWKGEGLRAPSAYHK